MGDTHETVQEYSTPTKPRRIRLIDHTAGCRPDEHDHTPDRRVQALNQDTRPNIIATACRLSDPSLNKASPWGSFVTYNCVISINGAEGEYEYSIRKRYSEFLKLRSDLRAVFPDVYLPKLPVKSFSPSQTSNVKFLEARRAGLELFIRGVVLNPQIGGHGIVSDWLEIVVYD